MSDFKFYEYKKCSTCRKARQFLDQHGISYESIDIVSQPPSTAELKTMAESHLAGNYRKLFNTSGQEYRNLNLKERLASMDPEDMLELLASNGKLIKRPFLLGGDKGTVGFKEQDWRELFIT
jgi:Spx/MgsR family transcriptional regulator